MASYKRQHHPFAGLTQSAGDEELIEGLCIVGVSATIFDDCNVASNIDSGRHLIQCFGDSELLVDRYDGRLLLDNLTAYSRYDQNTAHARR